MQTEVVSIALQAREPILAWGPPGVGKTSIIQSLGRALDLPVEVIIASVREPSDFAGLPVVDGDEVTMAAPDWARRTVRRYNESIGERAQNLLDAKDDGAPDLSKVYAKNVQDTIIFFDEISTAPPAVQAPLLRICLDKVVGDVQLPATTPIIAAANPPEVSAGGWDLAPPLANRFVHVNWNLDNDIWVEGMLSGFPDVTTKALPPSWTRGIPEARGLVASFIKARPNLLLQVPDDESSAGRAWPSPRSWDMAARLLAASNAYGAGTDIRAALVTGCVGDGQGFEFLQWLDALDLPDPNWLLANPDQFKLPERQDQVFAVLSSVVTTAVNKLTPPRWMAAWQIIDTATRKGTPDMAAFAAKSLAQERQHLDRSQYPIPVQQFKSLMPVLLAAGYTIGSS